jgi:DNA repair protein RecN (Recombination protein N)
MSIQAHKDGPKVALGKGASGGEMSRIMLALEVVIAASAPVGTYIFDEVDAGVGGKAAIEVGQTSTCSLKTCTSNCRNALTASCRMGRSPLSLWQKIAMGRSSNQGVSQLDDQARVTEIARMLAGLDESVSAQEHAGELLAMRAL